MGSDDPETMLAIAHAALPTRPALAALFALDERLEAIAAAAREPMIGRMRLLWWREAVARLDHAPPPAEPLLRRLAADLLPAGISGAEAAALVDGWDALLPLDHTDADAIAAHRAAGELLFALAGRILGAAPPPDAGAAWAVDRLRRRFGPAFPAVQPPHARWPRRVRPLGMLAILAGRDPAEPPASRRRLLRMLRMRLTGR